MLHRIASRLRAHPFLRLLLDPQTLLALSVGLERAPARLALDAALLRLLAVASPTPGAAGLAEGGIAWQEGANMLEEDAEGELKTLLLQFESLELTEVSDATPEGLAKRGLAPPAGTLKLATRPFEGGEVTRYTILLGDPVGEGVRWAAVEGEGRQGQLFDEVVRDLQAFGASLPGAFPPPPQDPPK